MFCRRVLVEDRASRREGGRALVLRLDALEHRHGVGIAALAPPRAQHVVLVVAQRADHGDRFFGVERECRAVVLEQHHRLPGRGARRGAVTWCQEAVRIHRLGLVDVGVIEQPGAELHAQDPPHRVVEPRHRDPVLGQQLLAEIADVRAHHLHVGAGVQRGLRGVGAVGGDAVAAGAAVRILGRAGAEFGDRGVVAFDESVKPPLVLEDVGLGLVVGASGDAVDRVKRTHRGVGPGVDRGLERRQVEVAKPLFGHVGGVVLATAFGLAVRGEMLGARDDLVRRGVVGALGGLDPRGCKHRPQIGVFAGALGDPPPARLVRHVDHRAVDLLDADGCRLTSADRVVGGGHGRVEAARGAQWDREDRAVAVDRVVCEQDRDVQPRLLDRDVLEVVDLRRVGQAEDPADAGFCVRVGDLPVGQQLELRQLLVDGHPREQVVHAPLDALTGGLPCRLQCRLVAGARGGDHPARDQQAERDDRRHNRGASSSRSHDSLLVRLPM